MSDPIAVHVAYSVDDYVRATRFIQRRNFVVRYGFLVPALVTLVILIALYVADPHQFATAFSSIPNLIVVLIPVLVSPVLFLLSRRKVPYLLRRRVKKLIESSPAMNQPQRVIFDEGGVEGDTILSSGSVKWDAIIEATESEDDLFFFTAKHVAMFIPKRSFSSPEKQSDVRRLVLARMGLRAKDLDESRD